MCIIRVIFRGGGGFLLFLNFEISFAILYHCLGGVFGSARLVCSFCIYFLFASLINVLTSFLFVL